MICTGLFDLRICRIISIKVYLTPDFKRGTVHKRDLEKVWKLLSGLYVAGL